MSMPGINEHEKSTNGCQENGPFVLNLKSDGLLEAISYWVPPVPLWKPLFENKRSGLRIACVVGDRLYEGLRYEGEMMLLTPQNWRHVLTYGKPDFLLMESVWETATGHWPMSQNPRSAKCEELIEIIDRARQLSIPTVYWVTAGHEYHDHFRGFAAGFDTVFCADPRESEKLRAEGVAAEVLLPCVQPSLYNPYRLFDHYDEFHVNFLFDGWADLDRLTAELSILSEIKKYGLSIIESRNMIFRNRLEMLPEYRDCILGCLTEISRATLMKYAKVYLTFDQTLSTRTTQQWMSLEAAAARVPVVHWGAIEEDDLRQGFVTGRHETDDFLSILGQLNDNSMIREKNAHSGWRCVNQSHTFSRRIGDICEKLRISCGMKQLPKASVVIPAFKKELVQRCLQHFEIQTYPNKELIIVCNGDDETFPDMTDSPGIDVRIVKVPGELFMGECMNAGYLAATGDYCFRMNEEDLYGENYIMDMILHSNAFDVNVFGKPPAPVKFQSDPAVYSRRLNYQNCILSRENILEAEAWIGENTIGTKKNDVLENHYCSNALGEADLYYLLDSKEPYYVMTDIFNRIAERRENQPTQPWKIDSAASKNPLKSVSMDRIDFFV